MSALDRTCPRCDAAPGEQCRNVNVIGERRTIAAPHRERGQTPFTIIKGDDLVWLQDLLTREEVPR